jgi:hypothetical protein
MRAWYNPPYGKIPNFKSVKHYHRLLQKPDNKQFVMLANAGIQHVSKKNWIPVFTGMTDKEQK